jgi:hypothetical protein
MKWSASAQRATIIVYFAMLAAIYGFAWFLPAAALDHDAAVNLVTAKALAAGHGYVIDNLPNPVPQTRHPPLFPAALALFTLVSENAQWLKLLPLASAIGWLALMRRLLLRMGASTNSSLLITGIAAASPTVLFLSTNLLPESLFALLSTAALLALLSESALLAGLLAGLAALTRIEGIALIAACVLTLLVRRRFRSSAILAVTSTVIVAPWIGWSLAHLTYDAPLAGSHAASTIFTGLAANEKAIVLGHNIWDLFAAPIALLTGYGNASTVAITFVGLGWCFIARRQTIPDLFLLLYSLVLLFVISPPDQAIAPMLPFVLWVVWRVLRRVGSRGALAAIAAIVALAPLGPDAVGIIRARPAGNLSMTPPPPDDWHELQRLFTVTRNATAPGDVLLSNHDGVFFLNTGRKTVRGFNATPFELFYSLRPSLVTPDQLSRAILEDRAAYVIMTPDVGLPEARSWHTSVEALERGGIIEPVAVPGAAPGYQLFRAVNR